MTRFNQLLKLEALVVVEPNFQGLKCKCGQWYEESDGNGPVLKGSVSFDLIQKFLNDKSDT